MSNLLNAFFERTLFVLKLPEKFFFWANSAASSSSLNAFKELS